ncbi:MAG: hypothetical protein WC763_00240 [Candidatus Paceibacterota bacterium]|jgi:hypothetical protein
MHIPYVGITDFTKFEQVEHMLRVFKAHIHPTSTRKLHVGVMMSYKTLHGLETKWSKAFPPKETVASIFASGETYNCLHYADYDKDPDFDRSLDQAVSYGGFNLNAVQLDMVWPEPDGIAYAVPGHIEVILQVGKNAIEQADNSPDTVVTMLGNYEGLIDRVLLDKSMGRGLGMDAIGLLPFARAIRKRFPTLGLVAAGGLGPDTMHLVEPLVREFPDLSIDAQGRLRPSGNALDPIDWEMAGSYLCKAFNFLE